MSIRYQFTHYCPYLEKMHVIYLDYAKLNFIGDVETHYKITGYQCDYVNDCPYPDNDLYGRCPVYLDAPDEPT